MKSRWEKKKKPIYLYDINKNLMGKFDTTDDCADAFEYNREYIYHNLKYCKKIWNKQTRKWYVIKREMIKDGER